MSILEAVLKMEFVVLMMRLIVIISDILDVTIFVELDVTILAVIVSVILLALEFE